MRASISLSLSVACSHVTFRRLDAQRLRHEPEEGEGDKELLGRRFSQHHALFVPLSPFQEQTVDVTPGLGFLCHVFLLLLQHLVNNFLSPLWSGGHVARANRMVAGFG